MSRASDLERQMLALINEERTSRDLEPVQLELRLNESSEEHSQWMLDEDRFSHTGVDGSSAGDRMRDADFEFEGNWRWGENIAYQSERGAPGFEDDVVDLHNSLMNSPGHRANILNPDYEVVGLGIEAGDFNGREAIMATQNFATTDAELQLDQPGNVQPETPTPNPEPAPEPETPTQDLAPEPEEPDPEREVPMAELPDPETEGPAPTPEMPDSLGESPFLKAFLASVRDMRSSFFNDDFTFDLRGRSEEESQRTTIDMNMFASGFIDGRRGGEVMTETDGDIAFLDEATVKTCATGPQGAGDWDFFA